jgi:hypothetical protein
VSFGNLTFYLSKQICARSMGGLSKMPFLIDFRVGQITHFYLPHMGYEESIGLLSKKIKQNCAPFNFLGLFMTKYMI